MSESTLKSYAAKSNLCETLGEDRLLEIGRKAVELAGLDDASRKEWMERSERGMELAKQIVEPKSTPFPNAANIKYPLLTVAALQFHARAYPALVPDKVAKGKVTGADPQGAKLAQANRIAAHMNYQLLDEMAEWESDTDRLLLALPIEGCEFKKSYFDPGLGRNVSEWVRPADFIVNAATKNLAVCPRMTHRLFFYPQEIVEKQRMGVWRDVDLHLSPTEVEEDTQQECYEQHSLLDLDVDGYKEPYILTVHKESNQLLRLRAAYREEDIRVVKKKVAKVTRSEFFTKYPFIPDPAGGFYDIGFGWLCGPLSDAIDTSLNQLIDAGTLQNTLSGLVRQGVGIGKEGRGKVRLELGTFQNVKGLPAGASLRDSVMPFEWPGPSAVLFNLLELLIQSVKDITSVQDIMTGESRQNETATTTMARIEQSLKLFTAIYKRQFRALGEELKKLYRLNSVYLDPETYFRVLDEDAEGVVYLADYRNDGTDVQPVADPTIATTTQALMKVELLRGAAATDPNIDGRKVTERFLQAIGEKPEELMRSPEDMQAPPDPKMMELELKARELGAKNAELAAKIKEIEANATLKTAQSIEALARAEAAEVGSQLEAYKLELEALRPGGEAGQPGDAGVASASGEQVAEGIPSEPSGGLPEGGPGLGEPIEPEPGEYPDDSQLLQGEVGGLPGDFGGVTG